MSVDWELALATEAPGTAGPSLVAVLWMTPDPGYYAYGNPPGGTGLPTTFTVQRPDGEIAPQVYYPPGKKKPDSFDPTITINAYEGATPIFMVFDGLLAAELDILGKLKLLLCSDVACLPVEQEAGRHFQNIDPAALPLAEETPWWPTLLAAAEAPGDEPAKDAAVEPAPAPETTENYERALEAIAPDYLAPSLEVTSLGKAVLFAFLAGLLLNFMPCVLPVISLKLSTLVAASGVAGEADKRRTFREHNIFFALGVLLYFGFLGVVLSLAGLAWGQLFQQPELIMGVAALVFALSLSLFGLFDLPVVDLKAPADTGKHPRTSALFTGLLATLLATPCSGPFLGGVLGWVLLQPPAVTLTVFFAIGLGMASPYLVMAVRPGLVRLFPKPGAWTIYLERVVGFFLAGTVIYLLEILPDAYDLPALTLLFITAFAAWMWGKWTTLSDSAAKRWTIRALALALGVGAFAYAIQPPPPEADWVPFDPAAFQARLGQDRMIVDFTADWCPNCKVLESIVFTGENMARWRKQYGLVPIQADLTEDNPPAQALLRALGSQSIPLVAVFPAGDASQKPLVLRDLFTTGQLEDALAELFPDK